MSATKIRTDLLLATSLELWHKLAGYVVLVLLARHLAKAAMGDLLLALAVSSFGAVVTELGTSRLLVREIAQGAEATLARLGEVLALRVPLAAAVYAALVGGTFALRPALGPVVALAAAAVLLGDLYHSFGAVFVGRREVWLRLATGMVGSLVLIPLVVLALRLGAGLGGVLVCYVAAAAVSLAVAAAAVRARVGPVRVAWGASAAWAAAQPAFPFFLMTALGLAHFKADTVLLYLLASPATVATYEAAYKFLEASRFLVRPATLVFLPLCAALAARGEWAGLGRARTRLALAATGLGLMVTLVGLFAADPIVPLVWGERYRDAVPALRVLAVAAAPVYLGVIATFLAAALHAERAAVWVLAGAFVANVALNLLVIPRYGVVGAAWSTVATEALGAAGLLAVVQQAIRRARLRLAVAPPAPELVPNA